MLTLNSGQRVRLKGDERVVACVLNGLHIVTDTGVQTASTPQRAESRAKKGCASFTAVPLCVHEVGTSPLKPRNDFKRADDLSGRGDVP